MASSRAPFQISMSNADQEKLGQGSQGNWWQRWSLRKKIIVGVTILLVIVAVAVGLGIGLSRGGGSGDDGSGDGGDTTPPDGTIRSELWRPVAGTTWNYELLNPVDDTSADAEVWDVDLFNNDQDTFTSLQSEGRRVLCYFSAGSFENFREDKDQFEDSDLGNNVAGWEGERWLDTNSVNVRKIMQTRLNLAVLKHCDGVEPDNVDAYDNDNGLDLVESDAVDYITFLSDEAHARNLSLALKNAGAIVPDVIDRVEYCVQEQCLEFNNCDQYTPFIDANKPVFHVEYPKGDETSDNNLVASTTEESICGNSTAAGFSTIIKNINLDTYIQSCPPNETYSGN